MTFKKVLLINIEQGSLDPEYWEALRSLSGSIVSLTKDDPKLKQEIVEADCVLTGFGVSVTPELIDLAPQLKYVGVLATAYGRVDSAYAKPKGIVVTNVPGYSTEGVAEFTFAVILEHIRGVCIGKLRAQEGNYSESGISAWEIKGKTFGVLGLGSIGGRVAEIAQGFGAQVVYWSGHRHQDKETTALRYQEIDQIISTADFLSINLAQTPETEQLMNQERFSSLKPGAVVINTAPMELIEIEALVKRLEKGDITFIMDHSDDVPKEVMKRLSAYKNFVPYPPMAYITKEARQAKQDIFLDNIRKFLDGKPVHAV